MRTRWHYREPGSSCFLSLFRSPAGIRQEFCPKDDTCIQWLTCNEFNHEFSVAFLEWRHLNGWQLSVINTMAPRLWDWGSEVEPPPPPAVHTQAVRETGASCRCSIPLSEISIQVPFPATSFNFWTCSKVEVQFAHGSVSVCWFCCRDSWLGSSNTWPQQVLVIIARYPWLKRWIPWPAAVW